jgi:outer membrane protein assembly factor BamB
VAAALLVSTAAPARAATGSVAFQMDAAHTGTIDGVGLQPPLRVRWIAQLPVTSEYDSAGLSYPVVADGRVFVTTRGVDPDYTPSLFALDAATGTVLWSRVITGRRWTHPAYDAGRVFVLDTDGRVQAYAAADGTLLWQATLPGDLPWSGSPPVASGGALYATTIPSTGGTYAIRQSDGGLLWFTKIPNVSNGSPALDDSHVYIGDSCASYALSRATGALA